MGLLSGGNSSSSSKKETTTQNTGFSEISGQALAIQGSGNAVNFLDQGAIAGAFDFAKDALKFSETVNAQGAGLVSSAVGAVADSRKSESENISGKAITYISYAGIAFAAAWAIRGWAK